VRKVSDLNEHRLWVRYLQHNCEKAETTTVCGEHMA